MIVGGAVAYVDLRTQVKGRRLLDYLAILPLGLPGTVMAVGVLLAFIRPPFAIYGTLWILLVAYVARFVPLAARSANATLRQIDPSLEEAARISAPRAWRACGTSCCRWHGPASSSRSCSSSSRHSAN